MKTVQTISHVFNICNSAHTAIGVFIQDATDRSTRPGIDRRPLIDKIVRASDGHVLFTHTHGLHCRSTWTDDQGCVLAQFEEPSILPVEHFYAMFGGPEYCVFR